MEYIVPKVLAFFAIIFVALVAGSPTLDLEGKILYFFLQKSFDFKNVSFWELLLLN